ncbi:SprT-like domain-containing protein [Nocardioides sp. cx-173]|uniref:SprT-like domain-containing protein n=1 Tax=Nocardioides sp. cx-173 TaxID=2898796 RepID=UPI001E574B94|nr:SprT-like domain-containing protein [Nocardioides sp. cx-173]MCD4527124.1 SprT-like domain-containing protein [Nocardioides sp. cx-173]UGB42487.1 SprT-like domain-containing protein [Nocardioides sp. cx-173]
MQLAEAARLGRSLLDEHGLHDWELVFDRAKRRAGICREAERRIGLSAPLTQVHSEEDVRDTILHEIAHALVGARHGHDRVWKATARRIGCSGERLISADTPGVDGAWVGVCAAGHRVTRHRRPQRPMACATCSRAFDPAHLFTWTHHGRSVAMTPAYDAQLRRVLARPAAPQAGPPADVGERLRVVAQGRYEGVVGTLVKRGRTRYHLAIRGGVLTVPFPLAERVDAGRD